MNSIVSPPDVLPNLPPTAPFSGLVVLAEAPSQDDHENHKAFSGNVGRYIKHAIRAAGIDPDSCFFGYCAATTRYSAKPTFDSIELTEGLSVLRSELAGLEVTTILTLGNLPFKCFYPSTDSSIHTHRGSLYLSSSSSPLPHTKSIGTHDPAEAFRVAEYHAFIEFDVRRACQQASFRRLELPVRRIQTEANHILILQQLERCMAERALLSVDIEGGVNGISCIGIARSPSDCFVIPFFDRQGNRTFAEDVEATVLRALARVLADPSVPKVLQHSLYDNFVLSYVYKMPIFGVIDDTMVKHMEYFCELPKSLAFQTSIHTLEPYYKDERKGTDQQTFLNYCGKDCCVTYEINSSLNQLLASDADAQRHYRTNIGILPGLLYMEINGIRYDSAKAALRRAEVLKTYYNAQHQINLIAGRTIDTSTTSIFALFDRIKHIVFKKTASSGLFDVSSIIDNLLGAYRPFAPRLKSLLETYPNWSDADNAEFCDITDIGMNVKGDEFKLWFYKMLSLPPVLNRKTKQVTVDYETVLRLAKKTKNPLCTYALIVSEARTHEQMLSIHADPDGRIRTAYNLVGTVTLRMTSSESPTGSGYNLQTIPEGDRDLYLADEGYEMFQCDLKGADAWTVACHCKAHGDSTMLDDMQAGIQVAKVLALMFTRGAEISKLTRGELLELCKTIPKGEPLYFGSKCCQHGSNYAMAEVTMSFTIFKQSEGKVDIETSVCKRLKELYTGRYWGIKLWHNRSMATTKATRKMKSAAGHTRRVFDRLDDYSTHQALFAHEPQVNTTFATNMALLRLITDPENRQPNGDFIIKPVHQVHDALVGQWPKHLREWAIKKVRSYFQNPITIAGTTLVIPFDGTYGPSWGEKVGEFK